MKNKVFYLNKKFNSVKTAVIAGTLTAPLAFCSENSITIPDCGVDVAGYATAAITTLGGVVAAVALGYVGFLVIRKGLRWIRTL